MSTLSKSDLELIEAAKIHAKKMYDHKEQRTTISAALRTKSGKIYTGINLKYRVRSASMCAERIALFKALDEGDGILDLIVGVKYFPETDTYEVVNSCGECRQVFIYNQPLEVIVNQSGNLSKINVQDLLPFSFS